ncbi:hypothetical protein FIC27_11925 [Escherichia coli]|nr:hypothetical protein FIC27_11925 [Escherichia coli]
MDPTFRPHALSTFPDDPEPELVFEVKARRLKLLRMKSAKTESDRVRLQPDMEHLLAGLIAIDAARAAVLCNPGSS